MDYCPAWSIADFLLITVEWLSGTIHLLVLGWAAMARNTLIASTNFSDVSSVIASAMTVLDHARGGVQTV